MDDDGVPAKERSEVEQSMTSFECPHCGQAIDAPQLLGAAEGDCPRCGQTVSIPSGDQDAVKDGPSSSNAQEVAARRLSVTRWEFVLAGVALGCSILAVFFSTGDTSFRPVMAATRPPAGQIVVDIDATNAIHVNGAAISAAAELSQLVNHRADRVQAVTIVADGDALFDTVMLASRALYAGGVRQVIIMTRDD